MKEVTVSLAAATKISMDAPVAAALSNMESFLGELASCQRWESRVT